MAFVRGIHRGPVISPYKGTVTRKMFPFDDVIMGTISEASITIKQTIPYENENAVCKISAISPQEFADNRSTKAQGNGIEIKFFCRRKYTAFNVQM